MLIHAPRGPPGVSHPKTATVWLPQPTLHPTDRIVIRIDPAARIEEITRDNNVPRLVAMTRLFIE